MKFRLLYLLTVILSVISLVQCTDSVTGETEEELDQSLEEFSLIAPVANSKQLTSLTLEWQEIEDVNSFQIQLSTEKEFTSTMTDSTVDSTRFSIHGLPYDATVYWRVRPVIK